MPRFMRKGKTRFYFAPTIALAASTMVPTVAEITAGTRLDAQINAVTGFTFSNNAISTPDMASAFTSQISGEDAAEDSSLTFYEDDTTNPIQTLLAKGVVGYILIFNKGVAGATPAIADKLDVWPVVVASSAPQYTADNEAAKYLVKFSNRLPPAVGIAIAA